MKMKKLFVGIALVIISITTYSQESSKQSYHFGIKLAPSFGWLNTDTKGYESDGTKFGFVYGLLAEFNFADRYAFATGFDISNSGGKFKTQQNLKTVFLNEDSIVSTSSTYSLKYIDIPISLKLKTNEIGSVTYYAQLGLAPGFNIHSRMSYSSTTQTTTGGTPVTTTASEDNIDNSKDINTINLSMIIGGGIEYTLSGNTILLGGIQFNNGFLDVFDTDAKVNTNYLALTLGVLF